MTSDGKITRFDLHEDGLEESKDGAFVRVSDVLEALREGKPTAPYGKPRTAVRFTLADSEGRMVYCEFASDSSIRTFDIPLDDVQTLRIDILEMTYT